MQIDFDELDALDLEAINVSPAHTSSEQIPEVGAAERLPVLPAMPRPPAAHLLIPIIPQSARDRVGARLPRNLAPVERMSNNVLCIRGCNPSFETGGGTNTYLIGQGPRRILLDTADGNTMYRKALVETCLSELCEVAVLLLTHSHQDHSGGVAFVRSQWPQCQQLMLEDGEVVRLGGVTMQCVATPGHCNEHVAWRLIEEAVVFTGDLVLGQGTVLVLAPPQGDMDQYLASLLRLLELGPTTVHPGHGASASQYAATLR